jgi:predicted 3-demethylubiquinone-9 3-methyltransferase (glyoxalase superfamily)
LPFLKSKVRTCLWFQEGGHEAAAFYVSLLPDSYLEGEIPSSTEVPLVVEFTLAGAPMMILNGGPHFHQTPAASISVLTESQEETDRLWEQLTANGGQESQCGWLTDRWGVSWQIVPRRLPEIFRSPDREAAGRAQEAMMSMRKLDIEILEKAFAGN